MKNFSVEMLVHEANNQKKSISEIVMEQESIDTGKTPEELLQRMLKSLNVMEQAIKEGMNPVIKSASGLSGGNAFKLSQAIEQGVIKSNLFSKAMVRALAVSELNACMGRIVAAPTAGSAGILPAVLFTVKEEYDLSDRILAQALFTAAGIGIIIAEKASISGAEGGCQAECGSATGMAAAALVEMLGGTPEMSANACAIALKNSMGLVCDPVAGLVEVPCVKRNVSGAVNAFAAANLALAGIKSEIPVDEVIKAMGAVGRQMPREFKETAEGGIAVTPTAKRILLIET